MIEKHKDIEDLALKLPVRDRARLAGLLISSLEDMEDPESEKLWILEAEKRYRLYKQGKLNAKTADEVFRNAFTKFR